MCLSSSTANLPLDVLDAHFFASLVIIVVPFALRKINGGERRVGLDTGSLELTLRLQVSMYIHFAVEMEQYTSALKSTNSRPRQSMVRMFCTFAGSW